MLHNIYAKLMNRQRKQTSLRRSVAPF